ncbi:hypothetical protein [Pseudomonas aeruginosa]|uniref:hypothetical protein n=1 Tax=Pseudomonas aeruginosa TaxID=287 RepID=UPI001BCA38F1|nr:hypothetical protein [Pseudomonas aeruginosa]
MTHALFKQIDLTAKLGQDGSSLQAMNALRIIREAVAPHLANSGDGEVVVTKDDQGAIVAVTRQDQDGHVLSIIEEAAAEPLNHGSESTSGTVNTGERSHPAQGSGDSELAESLQTLDRWLDRVDVEDGYVGVPVIEAVEVVVEELKRQREITEVLEQVYGNSHGPVGGNSRGPEKEECDHCFDHGLASPEGNASCPKCRPAEQAENENAKRYLWLRDSALDAADAAREVDRKDKSIVNLIPRDKHGNLLADRDLDQAIDEAMATWPTGSEEAEGGEE